MQVVLRGRVTIYEDRGELADFRRYLEPEGAGALLVAFEQLKAKLEAEGFFERNPREGDPDTAAADRDCNFAAAAALRDILNILLRRHHTAGVLVFPALVQGDFSERGSQRRNTLFQPGASVDVIIVARGGGSAEDLAAFNNEALARVVAASEIPVISAVGHETDFTTIDFVANLQPLPPCGMPRPSIASQKLGDDALREATQFNKEIIHGAAEGIIVYDAELRYRVFNPFMERLTGKKAEEVLGKVAVEVFPRLRTSGIEDILKRALAGEVVQISDVVVPKHSAEGRDVWESCTFAPHFDAHENIVGVIGLVHDITDRHLAEETFRAIVVGTASSTGSDFFPSLVRHMATALHVRYAFITECDDGKHAKALAFWNGTGFGDYFEFDVAGTPCLKVVQGEICHYRENLVQLFPLDTPLADMGAESYLGIPMFDLGGKVIGHIAIIDDKPMERDERAIDLLKIFAARAAAELKRQRAEIDLQAALQQVQVLQKKLEAENVYLQEEIRKEHNFEEIVGNSPALLDVLRKVETVAPTDSTVLVLGETGCGKELIARAIHNRSKRKSRPLVKVNCGAIPTGLVESELFGHMKGAFTGALERRTGRFELADGGTLFLDEVSELPLDTQVKLLRVLQEHEFEPLGSSRTVKVNVRIIAASNRDLEKAVQEGRFRADLFYRLYVLPMTLPPLRQRRSDIALLTHFFVERFSRQFGKRITGVAQDTMEVLSGYAWPGNIRELQNVIERAVVLCPGTVLKLGKDLIPISGPGYEEATTVGGNGSHTPEPSASLEDVERSHIIQVLKQTQGVIEGPSGAAKILDLHPSTLRSRMKKLGIERYSAPRLARDISWPRCGWCAAPRQLVEITQLNSAKKSHNHRLINNVALSRICPRPGTRLALTEGVTKGASCAEDFHSRRIRGQHSVSAGGLAGWPMGRRAAPTK